MSTGKIIFATSSSVLQIFANHGLKRFYPWPSPFPSFLLQPFSSVPHLFFRSFSSSLFYPSSSSPCHLHLIARSRSSSVEIGEDEINRATDGDNGIPVRYRNRVISSGERTQSKSPVRRASGRQRQHRPRECIPLIRQ